MIDMLRGMLDGVPDCELRRCGLKLIELWSEPGAPAQRLRDIDRCVFRAFGMIDVPAELLERDYEAALALLEALGNAQAALRQGYFERCGLRCIVGQVAGAYDERSPRYAAAAARPTGNDALDWHVAATSALGYEWDGSPAVLQPARVDVYRYADSAPAEIARVEPALVACGRPCELRLRGTDIATAHRVLVGGVEAEIVSARADFTSEAKGIVPYADQIVARLVAPSEPGWLEVRVECEDVVVAKDLLWAYAPMSLQLDGAVPEGAEAWDAHGRVDAWDGASPVEIRKRHEVMVRGVLASAEERVVVTPADTSPQGAAPPAPLARESQPARLRISLPDGTVHVLDGPMHIRIEPHGSAS